MDIPTIRAFLGWCAIINMGLLLWWWCFLVFAHDWVYRWHSKWFKLSVEQFDVIHYAGMTYFKIAIFVLNIVPYFGLMIVE